MIDLIKKFFGNFEFFFQTRQQDRRLPLQIPFRDELILFAMFLHPRRYPFNHKKV